MKFTPRPYQDMIIRHIIGTPRAMVWAGMGMGKTASALFALDLLKRLGEDAFPVLILAPLRVAPDDVAGRVPQMVESRGQGSAGGRKRKGKAASRSRCPLTHTR